MTDQAKILLGHGSGGKLTRELVRKEIIGILGEQSGGGLDDGAVLSVPNRKIVFTTDSYVVSPIEFPGGNIGTLAVCGTVNDLAVMGACPLFLSLGMILEEGCEISLLRTVIHSISEMAAVAGVKVVCGDTKVVEKGKGDKIFINTSGIGSLEYHMDETSIRPGDKVIINGTVGDHGMALLMRRKGYPLKSGLKSDCTPLNGLIERATGTGYVKWMRDPTRGGVATALNELAEDKTWSIELDETSVPYHPEVEGAAEILGLDPLYSANEGKVLMVVEGSRAEDVLAAVKGDRRGAGAAVIGEITDAFRGKLVLNTAFGTKRTLGMLNSDPLPRIC